MFDEEKVISGLNALGTPYQKRDVETSLTNFIDTCGYKVHPIIVNLTTLETVDADIGVVVTHKDEANNDGTYVFCVLKNNTLGLITIVPSTISKSVMVRRVSGDVTNAIQGIDMPPLTTYDMVEVVGQVIANTVMKMVMSSCNIPKDKEWEFVRVYMPKFLSNVAMQYVGATNEEGKPMVHEEITDMEPTLVRQMVMKDELPPCFKREPSEERGTSGEGNATC